MRLPTMSVVCLASLLAISQQRDYVPMAFIPVDESRTDPDLMAFRDRLRRRGQIPAKKTRPSPWKERPSMTLLGAKGLDGIDLRGVTR